MEGGWGGGGVREDAPGNGARGPSNAGVGRSEGGVLYEKKRREEAGGEQRQNEREREGVATHVGRPFCAAGKEGKECKQNKRGKRGGNGVGEGEKIVPSGAGLWQGSFPSRTTGVPRTGARED